MVRTPKEIQKLLEERKKLRSQKAYAKSDALRKQIELMGYEVADEPGEKMRVRKKDAYHPPRESFLVLFGSGEIAHSAQKAHSRVLEGIGKDEPRIAIISTPAGFQPNVKTVCEEIRQFFQQHLQNYHPRVEIIYANTFEQCNNATLIQQLHRADYIFAGPGSPTYAVRALKNSLLRKHMEERVRAGASLGLSSAAAIAFSRFALPVYEIYKAGFDLYWEEGLDFYSQIFQKLTTVTHFNNNEGGKKNDTSRAWMGKERFEKLMNMLPEGQEVWGIDEHTAVLINLRTRSTTTLGKGKRWRYHTPNAS